MLPVENSECPEKITFETEGVVGGLRLRSFQMPKQPHPKVIRWALPVRPVIFLRGKKAGEWEPLRAR